MKLRRTRRLLRGIARLVVTTVVAVGRAVLWVIGQIKRRWLPISFNAGLAALAWGLSHIYSMPLAAVVVGVILMSDAAVASLVQLALVSRDTNNRKQTK
jgi:hypothetical protein